MAETRLQVESAPRAPEAPREGAHGAPAQHGEPDRPGSDDAAHAKQRASEVAGQAKERATEVAEQAKERASDVAEQAKGQVAETAEHAKAQAAQRVDEGTTQAGREIRERAGVLDDAAAQLHERGLDGPANAVRSAGDKVREVGERLEHADGAALVEAATDLVRENAAVAAAAGAAAGFAAGRVIKATRSEDGAHGDGAGDEGTPRAS